MWYRKKLSSRLNWHQSYHSIPKAITISKLYLKLSLFKPLRNSHWICLKTSLLEDFFSAKRSNFVQNHYQGLPNFQQKASSIVQRRANFYTCFAINLAFIKTLLLLKNTLIYICVLRNNSSFLRFFIFILEKRNKNWRRN